MLIVLLYLFKKYAKYHYREMAWLPFQKTQYLPFWGHKKSSKNKFYGNVPNKCSKIKNDEM